MSLDDNPNPVLDPALTAFRWPEPVANPTPWPEPEHRWEGPMQGATGSARKLSTTLVLQLTIRDGQVRGEGFSDQWPFDCPDGDRRVVATGDCAGDAIRLDLTFPTSREFRDKVFPFTGTISADRTEIRGSWTYHCDGRTCGGSKGSLVLTRVDDKA